MVSQSIGEAKLNGDAALPAVGSLFLSRLVETTAGKGTVVKPLIVSRPDWLRRWLTARRSRQPGNWFPVPNAGGA